MRRMKPTEYLVMFIIATAVFGIASAAFSPYPQQSNRQQADFEKNARILAYNSEVNTDSYRFNYETENGIKAEEQGREVEGIEAQGAFQYTGDDGQVYSVTYAAGQGGFQPQGAHLPTSPPIPEEILKALEQNARDEAAGIIDDGQYNPAKYGSAPSGNAFVPQQNFPRAQTGFRKPYKF